MRPRLLVAVAAGVGLGTFSVLADGVVRLRTFDTLGNIIAPWAIVAFAVGRSAGSAGRGAVAGGGALLVGVATYYVLQAARLAPGSPQPLSEHAVSPVAVVWLVAAVAVGPLMGWAGAESRRERPPIAAAVALPVLLVAEAGFLVVDRRPWLWSLSGEPYRLGELAVMVGLVLVALALPAMQIGEGRRRALVYAVILGVGLIGVLALVGLYRLIVGLA
jgi:hypothetical protein